ncbi:hypothetical protein LMG23992_04276 [Cupriavidus laharis]|uniref:TniQ domain-containing protein n=1 Tax=Cupriavidus laharis TaxID=151654 RepID=A0ABN7Z5V3_9BURK|nr:hypothetical protein LMG23992_04276 [Cupriavidus laharis]
MRGFLRTSRDTNLATLPIEDRRSSSVRAAHLPEQAFRSEVWTCGQPTDHEILRGYTLWTGIKLDAKATVLLRERATRNVEFDRLRHRACFCPVCFQAEPVWRDEWQLRGVLACLLHGVRLVAECPICRRSLSWRRRDLGHCSCGFPLPLWPREVANDGEVAATRYVLFSEGPTGKTRCGWTGLSRQARVSFLRALGYAWLREAVTARQQLSNLDDRDARAFSAAGDAILSLKDPVSFLVEEFAEVNDSKFFELHKLVTIELYRGMQFSWVSETASELHQHFQAAIARFFAGSVGAGQVLSYWIPIFLGGSTNWPADIEPLTNRGGGVVPLQHRTIWANEPENVSLTDLRRAWLARQGGQSARDIAEKLNVPVSIIARMLRRIGCRKYGPEHRYPHQAVEVLLSDYRRTSRVADYIDVATVMRNGMTLDECVRRMLDPECVHRRAVALVYCGGEYQLKFAKRALPDCPSVRVVVPSGYGGGRRDVRWASVSVAAKFLRVERDAIIRWAREGRLGIVLPGVPNEEMGIPREALRRMQKKRRAIVAR